MIRERAILLIAVSGLSTTCLAQQTVYQDNARGTVIMTGNTLGLSGEFSGNGPGVEDSIHAFISLDSSQIDDVPPNPSNPWPAGTTHDYSLNGSTAELDLPDGAVVLHAELVWGGSYNYFPEDVTSNLGDSITFVTPQGTDSVSPAPATSSTVDIMEASGFPARYYLRSADVTALVAASGAGTYAVEGVPGTQGDLNNSANAAGWSLAVAIAAPGMTCKTLHLAVVGQWVYEGVNVVHTVGSLEVPPTREVSGRVLLSALEGDADLNGDSVAVSAGNSAPFVALSGDNNTEMNFFASQINDSLGVLDQRGLMGGTNHDATSGINIAGGRQGWDTTGIPVSSQSGELTNDMSELRIRFSTTGDSYQPAVIGFAVDTSVVCSAIIDEIFRDGFEQISR